MVELGSRRPIDGELEPLRGRLTESSSSLRAPSAVYRERLVGALARAIATRVGTDPVADPGHEGFGSLDPNRYIRNRWRIY